MAAEFVDQGTARIRIRVGRDVGGTTGERAWREIRRGGRRRIMSPQTAAASLTGPRATQSRTGYLTRSRPPTLHPNHVTPPPTKKSIPVRNPSRIVRAALAAFLVCLFGSTVLGGSPAWALEFYVDAAAGDDTRSALEAQSPATPWLTIGHALDTVDTSAGRHTIRVEPGVYPESAQTEFADVEIRPSGSPGDVVVAPPGGSPGIDITHGDVLVEGIRVEGGSHGIRAINAPGVVIRDCTVVGASFDGIRIETTTGSTVENSTVVSNGGRGISVRHASQAYLRNNLVYDNNQWGIDIDSSTPSDPQPPQATGHVLAFNTVAYNGSAEGGIRLKNATGELRDNIITDNTPTGLRVEATDVSIHHNLIHGNATPLDPATYPLGMGMLAVAPSYEDPAGPDGILGGATNHVDDNFALDPSSGAVDAGSGLVAERDIQGSTREDLVPDAGTADLGHHADASASSGIPPTSVGPATYYVATTGLDTRDRLEAQSPLTPWATINKALSSGLAPGDTVIVSAGTYAEAISTTVGSFTLITTEGAIVQPPLDGTGITIDHAGVLVEGFEIDAATNGAVHGIKATDADNLLLRRVVVNGPSENGIMVVDTVGAILDSNAVDGAGSRGILLDATSEAYLRNNLVTNSADWGIHFKNDVGPTSTGNIVAFNTVATNGAGATNSGGIRLQGAVGEIRDNIVSGNTNRGIKVDTAPVTIHHNDVFGSATAYDTVGGQEPVTWENLAVDPLFVSAVDLRLQPSSPVIDSGSGPPATVDISGSTLVSGTPDSGTADMGYHAFAGDSTGAPTPAPPVPTITTYYVDCATGSDARTDVEAQNPGTPWLTILKALSEADDDEAIQVADGTCAEAASIEISRPGLHLRSENPLGTTVSAPAGVNTVNVEADGVVLEGFVVETAHRGVLVAPEGGGSALQGVTVRGLHVRPPPAGTIGSDAFTVRDADDVVVENNMIEDGLGRGLHLRRVQSAYVRNNLIRGHADWGIQIDDESGSGSSSGHVLAFNTVTANGAGIRFQTATGEIRENLVINNTGIGVKTDTAPVYVHHNGIFGNGTRYDTQTGQEPALWDNLHVDPLFTGTFRLSEIASGQASDSPALDAGSDVVANLDISGSTRTDSAADTSVANLGYHAGAGASTGVPAIASPPGGDGPYTYYVDAAAGDDGQSIYDARDPTTPWQTIERALEADAAADGDTVSIAAGTYTGTPQTNAPNVTLVATGAATLMPPGGQIGLRIEHPGVAVLGLVFQGGLHGIRATNADGLLIQGCDFSSQTANAIRTVATSGAVIDDNVTDGAGGTAILLDSTDTAYVRNNLVTDAGEWGIHLDNGDEVGGATDNIVAFNTVYGAGQSSSAGGIRFENATGEIRDNVLSQNSNIGIKTDTAPVYAHHNVQFASATAYDTASGQEPTLWANLIADPLFVDAPGGNFALQNVAAGQGATSPAVEQGSGLAAASDISGSTRSDQVADTDLADAGWHAGASPSAGAPPPQTNPIPEPGSGTTFYVDAVAGDNAHTHLDAQSSGTAWKTITYAVGQSSPGDVIRILAGSYAEQVNVTKDALTLLGDGSLGDVIFMPPGNEVGITVEDVMNVRIENIVVHGGSQGIKAERADGIRVTRTAVLSPTTTGIHFIDVDGAFIDGCRVSGAGGTGLKLALSSNLYVRNNLVYGNAEWGILVDNDAGADIAPGNVIAFNTVHQNRDGIGLLKASGEVRDNNITGHADLGMFLGGPLLSHHNNFATNARDRDRDGTYADSISSWSILSKSPRYVDPAGPDGILGGLGWADDDFRLQQVASGENFDSLMIDAGSDLVGNLDIGGSTVTALTPDAGTADVGFHYGSPDAVAAPAMATPPATLSETYFVSSEIGDDTRDDNTAMDRATPWETLLHAINRANPGDTIIVLPGSYVDEVSVNVADLTIRADVPGTVYFLPGFHPAISVSANGVTLDGLVVRGGTTGIISADDGDDLHIVNCAVVGQSTDAIRVTDASDVTIENSITSGALFSGIVLRRVIGGTVKNVLSYANGEWGVSFDNSPSGAEPLSTGNQLIGTTTAFNGLGNARLLNATGVVRDNLFTDATGTGLRIDTAGSLLHHNGFSGNVTPLDPESYLFCPGCTDNNTVAPAYVDPAGVDGILGGADWEDDDFRLPQIAAGDDPEDESPAVDFGSDLATALQVVGSTATSGTTDMGTVDIGYHYDSNAGALPSPSYTEPPTNVLYIDINDEDASDSHTRAQATSPDTPWQTLGRALEELLPGDTLVVAAGTYPEAIRIDVRDVTISGAGADSTVLQPGGHDGIRVRATGVRIEDLGIVGGRRGIAAQGSPDGLTIEDVKVTDASRDGIVLSNGENMSVSRVTVTGSRRYGIYVRKATGFQMRDCYLHANDRTGLGLIRTDGTVAFVTIYGNRDGVRSARNTITFRDSIIAGHTRRGFRGRRNDAVTMTHTLFGLNGRADVVPDSLGLGTGVQLATDPMFVDAPGGNLDLQGASPAINAGSDLAANLGVSGSTTGGGPDVGIADLGAHR